GKRRIPSRGRPHHFAAAGPLQAGSEKVTVPPGPRVGAAPPQPGGPAMIFSKLWQAIKAQFNKASNAAWSADPVAQLQYEYDKAVDQLREGRPGHGQYRALVDRV